MQFENKTLNNTRDRESRHYYFRGEIVFNFHMRGRIMNQQNNSSPSSSSFHFLFR